MNDLILSSPVLTMSSREIAELCEKRHDHVLRDIRSMLVSLYGDEQVSEGLPEQDKLEVFFDKIGWGIDSPKMGDQRIQGVKVQRDNRGYIGEIRLDYTHTVTLISGYRVKLRKAIIEKWQQLEAAVTAPALPDLSDPVVLVQLLTEHAGKRIEAEKRAAAAERKVIEVEPKAKFYDDFANAEGRYTLQNAGRVLTGRPNKFIQTLKEKHLFYQNGDLVPYVQFRQAGLFEVKVEMVNERARAQTFITPKGMEYFAKTVGGGNA